MISRVCVFGSLAAGRGPPTSESVTRSDMARPGSARVLKLEHS